MSVKKSTYRVDNGVGWDEHMLKTTADQVIMSSGINLEEGFKNINEPWGYTKLPNGVIVQWAKVNGLSIRNGRTMDKKINFPISFPNKCFCVTASISSVDGNNFWASRFTLISHIEEYRNKQGFWAYGQNNGAVAEGSLMDISYIAIGF